VNAATPPTITLITDFGDRGPFVGVMKAAIWALAPAARIIDLGHQVAQCWPAEAGFWLARVFERFPAGTVHVAVVDPGVGSERAILAAAFRGQYFLAPDNGILPMIGGLATGAEVRRVERAWLRERGLPEPSATFHGRDVFAPVAACLATGATALEALGPRPAAIVPAALAPPATSPDGIHGHIVTIDTWGNLITDIGHLAVERLAPAQVVLGERRIALARTYADAPAGTLLALINSFGTLEVACAQGNAEQLLGARRGDPVQVLRQRAGATHRE
jgi:S-adenosylmethionine hydrolase